MKTIRMLSTAAALVLLAASAASTASAAQSWAPVDYGTGYYGAGTATGGPSGGLPSRN